MVDSVDPSRRFQRLITAQGRGFANKRTDYFVRDKAAILESFPLGGRLKSSMKAFPVALISGLVALFLLDLVALIEGAGQIRNYPDMNG